MSRKKQGSPDVLTFFLIGQPIEDEVERILNDPSVEPVLIMAKRDGQLAARVYGSTVPNETMADLFDAIAINYRKAVQAARSRG